MEVDNNEVQDHTDFPVNNNDDNDISDASLVEESTIEAARQYDFDFDCVVNYFNFWKYIVTNLPQQIWMVFYNTIKITTVLQCWVRDQILYLIQLWEKNWIQASRLEHYGIYCCRT